MKSVSQIVHGAGSSKKTPFEPLLPGTALSKVAAALTLAVSFSLTACDNNYTLAYVYAPSETTTSSGLINAYGVDNQTGKLRVLADSPIPSGGRKPVAIAVAPNQKYLYVINHDDSNVVEFSIGTDGKLYPQNTYNTTGSYPTALAVSADGKFLYVAYTYQVGFTTASPGPGGISTFAINSDNTLAIHPAVPATASAAAVPASPSDTPVGRAPVAIATSHTPGYLYVAAQDAAAVNPAPTGPATQTLNLFAFATDSTSGQPSTLPGETIVSGNVPSTGYSTGIAPAGILADASGTHLYVTDSVGNIVIGYAITANGVPVLLSQSTSPGGSALTGSGPLGLTIDPSGKYLYVANSGSGSVSGYTFDASGNPIPSTVAASTAAGTGTNCVTIEPTHGIYLYASGLISNSITGEEIIPADGSLKPIINSPYAATSLPVCAVAVARF